MLTYIALTLSIINFALWIVLGIMLKKVFKVMYPIFKSLTPLPIYDTMGIPQIPGDTNS
jgi:uncharacterized membrane protein